jgi:glycyl-tRNA synthetase beta chain
LSPDQISVAGAADYLGRLHAARVVLDRDCRREKIREGLQEAAAAKGLSVSSDPLLLEEVTGLVEFPVVLMGAIDPSFMTLPREVLATAMRVHQKYFSCNYADSTPAPHFLFVADNLTDDKGKTIITGNERVLKARLADARFFWDQDLKVRLEDRVGALRQRVYHEKLGSVHDKVERVSQLAEFLAGRTEFRYPPANPELAKRAAWLAKADLSTSMVGEFPELQGIVGRYYYEAQHQTVDTIEQLEHAAIAVAIGDHYKPLGPADDCPRARESVVVALADKIDSLAAFFGIGEKPTGSRDPFALRRAAQGIIRLILENELRLPLGLTFAAAVDFLSKQKPDIQKGSLPYELTAFIADRLKVHLRDRGVRHDLIAAAFAQIGTAEDDLVRLLKRVDALAGFLASEDGVNLLTAYRRAANIVAIEEHRDNRRYDRDIDKALLKRSEEFALERGLELTRHGVERSLDREEFEAAMGHLATLRRPVDEFFDQITVNTDEPALRENRLRLLSRIRQTMNRVADFSQIEG